MRSEQKKELKFILISYVLTILFATFFLVYIYKAHFDYSLIIAFALITGVFIVAGLARYNYPSIPTKETKHNPVLPPLISIFLGIIFLLGGAYLVFTGDRKHYHSIVIGIFFLVYGIYSKFKTKKD